MFYFLKNWYEISKSEEIGAMLSLMEPLDDGEPAEPDMWNYWEDSIKKMEREGAPPKEKLK